MFHEATLGNVIKQV